MGIGTAENIFSLRRVVQKDVYTHPKIVYKRHNKGFPVVCNVVFETGIIIKADCCVTTEYIQRRLTTLLCPF